MQSFSISEIELLTGIKSHTLRIWEQRYAFFKARRKESNQRFYTNEDLQKLLCVSFLYHNGWKVSKIDNLSDDELNNAVAKTEEVSNNYQTYLHRLLRAAIDFNETVFLQTLNDLTEKIGFERMIEEVCYPYLHRVGMLWDTNGVIPAQEHFSSYIIQNRLISETEKFTSRLAGEPEIILFCPEKEYHELPLLYINYLLRKNGWKVLYLGKNITMTDLKDVVILPGIKYLYMHLLTNFTGLHLDDYFENLLKSFPDKSIIASGRAISQSQRTFTNLSLLKTDKDIYSFIQQKP